MFVLFVILAGFGFALYVLRRHRYTELSDIVVAVMSVVDSGLYADLAPETYQDAGVVQLAVFTTFMIITQIVLLNLLIAIMSDSYAKVRSGLGGCAPTRAPCRVAPRRARSQRRALRMPRVWADACARSGAHPSGARVQVREGAGGAGDGGVAPAARAGGVDALRPH